MKKLFVRSAVPTPDLLGDARAATSHPTAQGWKWGSTQLTNSIPSTHLVFPSADLSCYRVGISSRRPETAKSGAASTEALDKSHGVPGGRAPPGAVPSRHLSSAGVSDSPQVLGARVHAGRVETPLARQVTPATRQPFLIQAREARALRGSRATCDYDWLMPMTSSPPPDLHLGSLLAWRSAPLLAVPLVQADFGLRNAPCRVVTSSHSRL